MFTSHTQQLVIRLCRLQVRLRPASPLQVRGATQSPVWWSDLTAAIQCLRKVGLEVARDWFIRTAMGTIRKMQMQDLCGERIMQWNCQRWERGRGHGNDLEIPHTGPRRKNQTQGDLMKNTASCELCIINEFWVAQKFRCFFCLSWQSQRSLILGSIFASENENHHIHVRWVG